jgi:hypothetical protein
MVGLRSVAARVLQTAGLGSPEFRCLFELRGRPSARPSAGELGQDI